MKACGGNRRKFLAQGAGILWVRLVRRGHGEGNGKVKVGAEVSCLAVTDGTVRQSVS